MEYQSEKIDKILPAFMAMQQSMSGVAKNKKNDYFKSDYADLYQVLVTIKEAFAENDLCHIQTYEKHDDKYCLVTTIYHTSGQFFRSYAPIIGATNPQTLGSCTTYLRRYALTAMCGLAQKDDDGNAATFISEKQFHYLLNMLNGNPKISQYLNRYLDDKYGIKSFQQIPHNIFNEVLEIVNQQKGVQNGTGQ